MFAVEKERSNTNGRLQATGQQHRGSGGYIGSYYRGIRVPGYTRRIIL